MMAGGYLWFKRLLPKPLRDFLGAVNQRFFARSTLQRKYGDWFEVDWREKYRSISDGEWRRAYDEAWKNKKNDCLEETDERLFLERMTSPGSVLDVGCGQGSLAIRLSMSGFQVTGVDVSREALSLAERNATRAGAVVRWAEGFAEKLPFPDKAFDYLTCAHTLEHVRDLPSTVSEFKRVTKKKILILTPRQEFKKYMDNYHTQFFDRREVLVDAFGLVAHECREIGSAGRSGEFQGTAWFYAGDLIESHQPRTDEH